MERDITAKIRHRKNERYNNNSHFFGLGRGYYKAKMAKQSHIISTPSFNKNLPNIV